MKNPWAVGGVIAAVCVVIAIYYAIPGVYHVLTFSGKPTDPAIKHVILFAVLAVVALVGARFAANSRPGAR